MTWQSKARELSEGKWIKFTPERNARTVTFLGEPDVKTMKSTFPPYENYDVMEFPVETEGRQKILSPPQGLLRLIIEEDEEESIMGRTFLIKMLLQGKTKIWKLKEVAGQRTIPMVRDQMPQEATEDTTDEGSEEEGDNVAEEVRKPVKEAFRPNLPEDNTPPGEAAVQRKRNRKPEDGKEWETDEETSERVKKEFNEINKEGLSLEEFEKEAAKQRKPKTRKTKRAARAEQMMEKETDNPGEEDEKPGNEG